MPNSNFYSKFLAAGLILAVCFFIPLIANAQVKWVNVDSAFGPMPANIHVFKTTDSLDGKPCIAYYVKAKLKDRTVDFTTDTTLGRRLTPRQFYEKNNNPTVVVNGTFFSFETNRNLNTVIKDGKLVGYNIHSIPMKGKDTFMYKHPFGSAIGISKKRNADVAWLITDSSKKRPYASQNELAPIKDAAISHDLSYYLHTTAVASQAIPATIKKWKMKTAIGGGPVLVQNGLMKITNEAELKFTGKAINDKHPRTCMGYTNDGYLIVMAIQGRFPGIAEGASLEQEARLMMGLGCTEALNLDGGGSSCLLVNGIETIKPSDKTGERPVPAVFIIRRN